jgi:hypothetical protein
MERQQKSCAIFKEEDICSINSEAGYDLVKLAGEIQLGMMEECRSAVARIFNAYGECYEYKGMAQVVPTLIREKCVKIYNKTRVKIE